MRLAFPFFTRAPLCTRVRLHTLRVPAVPVPIKEKQKRKKGHRHRLFAVSVNTTTRG